MVLAESDYTNGNNGDDRDRHPSQKFLHLLPAKYQPTRTYTRTAGINLLIENDFQFQLDSIQTKTGIFVNSGFEDILILRAEGELLPV